MSRWRAGDGMRFAVCRGECGVIVGGWGGVSPAGLGRRFPIVNKQACSGSKGAGTILEFAVLCLEGTGVRFGAGPAIVAQICRNS